MEKLLAGVLAFSKDLTGLALELKNNEFMLSATILVNDMAEAVEGKTVLDAAKIACFKALNKGGKLHESIMLLDENSIRRVINSASKNLGWRIYLGDTPNYTLDMIEGKCDDLHGIAGINFIPALALYIDGEPCFTTMYVYRAK